jgi:chemotaxis protein CheX
MTASMELPARLDTAAAPALAADILSRSGSALRLDASGVVLLGGLCLQVLVAAAAEWRAQGVSLAIEPRSPGFDGALATFGLAVASLMAEGRP